MALRELHNHICELWTKHPETFILFVGDINQAKLTDILPRFYQHVSIATRDYNMLDHVYTNRREAYKAMPRLHLGFSDHTCVLPVPTHCPVLKNNKPAQKTITVLSAPTGRYSGKQQLMRAGWTWRTPLHLSVDTSASVLM